MRGVSSFFYYGPITLGFLAGLGLGWALTRFRWTPRSDYLQLHTERRQMMCREG